MRTDFAPFYRSTVGFDRLFDMLDAGTTRPEWPPYDIERKGEIIIASAWLLPTSTRMRLS
jgi:HSP20 family molecular chaperone IbpA